MAWRLKKTIVMVGMMGAGKTAVGTQLARDLGVGFLDSDEEIERAAAMTVSEIFARDGEPFFREKESQVISRLLDGTPRVLSTGGGAFLAPANREMIHARGVSVWLRADLALLWSRVRHRTSRPLLRTPDPKGTLGALYAARVPIYAEADVTVDTAADYAIAEMATKVAEVLAATRPDVLEKVQDD